MQGSRDTALDRLLDKIGCALARRLDKPAGSRAPYTHGDHQALAAALMPADVLLVEGDSKIGAAIKYLTQSTWSHAALHVGTALDPEGPPMLVEVEVGHGCIAATLAKYAGANLRICRACGLGEADRRAVTGFMVERIGLRYDMRNIIDLARYLLPEPPVPRRFRRRMLALGSGDPTRAICSSLIAQAFQSIRYPILPTSRSSGTAATSPAGNGGRSCTSGTTRSSRRATSTSRLTSRSSSRGSRRTSTTGG